MNDDTFFKGWFIFCALMSLVVCGVGIWAAIVLVQWLVTK